MDRCFGTGSSPANAAVTLPPLPDLDFRDEAVPKFNIPNPANAKGEAIDPNQIDFLNETATEEDDLLPDIFNDDEKEDDDLLP